LPGVKLGPKEKDSLGPNFLPAAGLILCLTLSRCGPRRFDVQKSTPSRLDPCASRYPQNFLRPPNRRVPGPPIRAGFTYSTCKTSVPPERKNKRLPAERKAYWTDATNKRMQPTALPLVLRKMRNTHSCLFSWSVRFFHPDLIVYRRRQHFLYFLPLPHGQGSLRPMFLFFVSAALSKSGSLPGLGMLPVRASTSSLRCHS